MDASARAVIIETAKAHAPDYYLSALLAPRNCRDDLLVLAAFEGELDRIPLQASEPMIAEIRLQWWRDWISGRQPGKASGNPLADALTGVIDRHGLGEQHLLASIDARSTLDDETPQFPMPGMRRRLKARDLAAMERAARVLGAAPDPDHRASFEAAGLALTFARLALLARTNVGQPGGNILNLKGELQQARHNLQEVRAAVRHWPKPLRLAALPVALVEPYLHACEVGAGVRGAAQHSAGAILPLTRVWRLWRFARLGRL